MSSTAWMSLLVFDEQTETGYAPQKQASPLSIDFSDVKDAATKTRILEKVGIEPDISTLCGFESERHEKALRAEFNTQTQVLNVTSQDPAALSSFKRYLSVRGVAYMQRGL